MLFRYLALITGLFSTLIAQPQESVEVPVALDNKIIQITSIFGSNATRTWLQLGSDSRVTGLARYSGLARFSNLKVPGSGWSDVSDGAFEYIPGVDDTASLVLIPDEGNSRSRVLKFQSSEHGFFADALFDRFVLVDALQNVPLVNTSVRVRVRPKESVTAGFVMQKYRRVLIRVIGPTLSRFQLRGVESIDASIWRAGEKVGELKTRGTSEFPSLSLQKIESFLGAFPFEENASDVFWFGGLAPGIYTVEAKNTGDLEGEALIETYLFPM